MDHLIVSVIAEEEGLLPTYSSAAAAGADVRANIRESVEILPGESMLIPTGIRVEIPEGYEIQVRPRSGLALKQQITVLNTPGTIDADYRGEIGVILINHGKLTFTVLPQMRIAQLVATRVFRVEYLRREVLESTLRGEGGFGHTGLR